MKSTPATESDLIPIEEVVVDSEQIMHVNGAAIRGQGIRVRVLLEERICAGGCGTEITHVAIHHNKATAKHSMYLSFHGANPNGRLETFTVDHIFPRSAGGSNRRSNLTAMCATCNQKKANQ